MESERGLIRETNFLGDGEEWAEIEWTGIRNLQR